MKILIGAPIDEQKLYCWEEFKNGLIQFGRDLGHDVLLVDTSINRAMQHRIKNEGFFYRNVWKKKPMDRVVAARNIIRCRALRGYADYKYSHVLMLDADAILHCDVADILKEHNKSIISALMNTIKKNGMPGPVPLVLNTFGFFDHLDLDAIGTGLRKVDRIGFGCALIKVNVLANTQIRCERDSAGKLVFGEDYCFSDDCKDKDYKLWVDTDLQVKHLIIGQWQWDTA